MKLPRLVSKRRAAFTLVEVAIALAVIGFALVAIIGVLPTGLEVQKNNREETIIDHDANYFLNAIRHGERGIDDLTNYVTAITIVSAQPDSSTTVARTYLNRGIQPPAGLALGTIMPQRLDSGRRIIGLLSTPSVGAPGSSVSNHVTAYVLALNGNATDKVPQQRRDVRESAFNYRMTVELTAPVSADSFASQTANLHDLRLMFRWPVQPGGKLGGGRAVYRAAVSGQLSVEEDGGATLHFFDPTTFALAQ